MRRCETQWQNFVGSFCFGECIDVKWSLTFYLCTKKLFFSLFFDSANYPHRRWLYPELEVESYKILLFIRAIGMHAPEIGAKFFGYGRKT